MFRDDYSRVDPLERIEYKGRLVKHREISDDYIKNIRTGRALAWDVTHTMNSLKEEVSYNISITWEIITHLLYRRLEASIKELANQSYSWPSDPTIDLMLNHSSSQPMAWRTSSSTSSIWTPIDFWNLLANML